MSTSSSLVALPLIAAAILFLVAYVSQPTQQQGSSGLRTSNFIELKSQTTTSSNADDDGCTRCPIPLSGVTFCSNKDYPVLGGLDMVQYFTTFKNDDGSYDETQTGSIGSEEFSSTFNGFSYWFLTQKNMELFEQNPARFIPKWGGYCAWGMSEESCPDYPWSSSCLGPSGNWGAWTIQEDQLFFFLKSTPKSNFLENVTQYILDGDERWAEWWNGDESEAAMNTQCYVTSDR